MRIAIVADTHGNHLALEAVLADIRTQAPDLIVNLGDLVSGGCDPREAAAAQMALACPTLAGNHERQVLGEGPGPTDIFARAQLSAPQLDWIAALPATLSLEHGTIFACHGSPAGGDLEYLLEDVASGRPTLADAAAIRPRLAGIPAAATLVLCGHSHTPRLVTIDHVTLLNPGSVGLPAYVDHGDPPHTVEAGSPHARYALATRQGASWQAEFRAIAYDWTAAADLARTNGFPLHATWTATGRA